MAKSKDVHVVKSADRKGWDTKVAGQVASHHRTQGAAIDAGKGHAERRGSDLVVHGRDGKIREKNSYGNDPMPPRDMR